MFPPDAVASRSILIEALVKHRCLVSRGLLSLTEEKKKVFFFFDARLPCRIGCNASEASCGIRCDSIELRSISTAMQEHRCFFSIVASFESIWVASFILHRSRKMLDAKEASAAALTASHLVIISLRLEGFEPSRLLNNLT